jgi:hypothetical protein
MPLLNDISEFERAGYLAGKASRNGDQATVRTWREWVNQAKAMETHADQCEIDRVYREAYKRGTGC